MSVQRAIVLAVIVAAIVSVIAAFIPLQWASLEALPSRMPVLFAVAVVPAAIMGILGAIAPAAPAAPAAPKRERPQQVTKSGAPRPAPAPAPSKTPPGDRIRGTVKWFNRTKGFGFIICEDGSEIFVHHRSIRGDGRQSLRDGEGVDFVVVEHDKGLQADDVVRATA